MLSTLSTLLKRWNGQRFSSAGVTNASVALEKLSHCQRFFSAGNASNTAMNTNFGRRSLHAYKPVVTGACVYLSQNNVQRLRSYKIYKIYGSFYGSTLSQGYKWYPKAHQRIRAKKIQIWLDRGLAPVQKGSPRGECPWHPGWVGARLIWRVNRLRSGTKCQN